MLSFDKAIDLVRNVTQDSMARPEMRTPQGQTWTRTDSNNVDAPASKQRRRFVKPGLGGYELHIHRRRFGRRLFHSLVNADLDNIHQVEKNDKEDSEVSSFSIFMKNVNEADVPELVDEDLVHVAHQGDEGSNTIDEVDIDSPLSLKTENDFDTDPSMHTTSLKRSCRGSRNLFSRLPNCDGLQGIENPRAKYLLASPDTLEDDSSNSETPYSCVEEIVTDDLDAVSLLIDDDDKFVETSFQKAHDPDFDRLNTDNCTRKPEGIKISYNASDDNLVTFLGGFRGQAPCTRKMNRSSAIRGYRRRMAEDRKCSFELQQRLNEAFARIPPEFRATISCQKKSDESTHRAKTGSRNVTFDSQLYIRYFECEDTSISQ